MAHCGIYQTPPIILHPARLPLTCSHAKDFAAAYLFPTKTMKRKLLFPTLLPLSVINGPLCGAILGITRIALCGSRGVLGAVKKACCSSALLILFRPLACCAYIQTSSSSAAAGRRASHARARRLDEPFQEQS